MEYIILNYKLNYIVYINGFFSEFQRNSCLRLTHKQLEIPVLSDDHCVLIVILPDWYNATHQRPKQTA